MIHTSIPLIAPFIATLIRHVVNKPLTVIGVKLLSFLLLMGACSVQAKPLVVSSIKPLTLIAKEIAGTHADVDTLLPITASPHDYPLKVSDYKRLQKAELVLWIGPELESFLQKPLANLPNKPMITAYNLQGLHWPAESPAETDKHHHERDPHLWLDPRNAVVVARALSEQLAQIDPAHKDAYAANLQLFATKMGDLDARLRIALKPLAGLGFAVYHEGYGHFISHYGLLQLAYVTYTPEQRPGAKHLHHLKKVLAKDGHCLFLEPYNDLQSAQDLAQELQLPIGTLDALGSEGVTSYAQLLEHMSDAILHCLTHGRSKRHL